MVYLNYKIDIIKVLRVGSALHEALINFLQGKDLEYLLTIYLTFYLLCYCQFIYHVESGTTKEPRNSQQHYLHTDYSLAT